MSRRDKTARLEYQREWYRQNRAHVLAQRRAYVLANPEKAQESNEASKRRYHSRYRERKLAKTYGVSVEEIRQWLRISQCEICGAKQRRMVFDHDHRYKTGVRGRLCTNCNSGLGHFKDRPETLIRAARYIRSRIRRRRR